MCPFCIASAVLMAGSVISAGGLTALVVKKLSGKSGTKKSFQDPNPKEETWEK
jgi:hypothetical protein